MTDNETISNCGGCKHISFDRPCPFYLDCERSHERIYVRDRYSSTKTKPVEPEKCRHLWGTSDGDNHIVNKCKRCGAIGALLKTIEPEKPKLPEKTGYLSIYATLDSLEKAVCERFNALIDYLKARE